MVRIGLFSYKLVCIFRMICFYFLFVQKTNEWMNIWMHSCCNNCNFFWKTQSIYPILSYARPNVFLRIWYEDTSPLRQDILWRKQQLHQKDFESSIKVSINLLNAPGHNVGENRWRRDSPVTVTVMAAVLTGRRVLAVIEGEGTSSSSALRPVFEAPLCKLSATVTCASCLRLCARASGDARRESLLSRSRDVASGVRDHLHPALTQPPQVLCPLCFK